MAVSIDSIQLLNCLDIGLGHVSEGLHCGLGSIRGYIVAHYSHTGSRRLSSHEMMLRKYSHWQAIFVASHSRPVERLHILGDIDLLMVLGNEVQVGRVEGGRTGRHSRHHTIADHLHTVDWCHNSLLGVCKPAQVPVLMAVGVQMM